MSLMEILFLGSVFLFTVALVEMFYLAWESGQYAEKRELKKRLLAVSASGRFGDERLSLYKKQVLDKAGPLQRLLFRLPRLKTLDRMLLKSSTPLNASSFVFLSIALGAMGTVAGLRLLPGTVAALVLGLALGCLPYLWLMLAEKRALAKFEEQLPETLDLLARSLRSGHAMMVGFEIVVEEMPEPITSEFAAAVTEINLGLSMKEALENMCVRVPSSDLRFFAIAVTIQRDTGGNLAEILDNISRLVRERMSFRRQVAALTAEGRLSAKILLALPVLMFVYLYVVNYDYVSLLWTEQLGRIMLAGAIGAGIVGTFVINRIVTIKP